MTRRILYLLLITLGCALGALCRKPQQRGLPPPGPPASLPPNPAEPEEPPCNNPPCEQGGYVLHDKGYVCRYKGRCINFNYCKCSGCFVDATLGNAKTYCQFSEHCMSSSCAKECECEAS